MTVVVDYDAGNIRSVETALMHLGEEHRIVAEPAQLASASRIVFPGVGDGSHAMEVLRNRGLDSALTEAHESGVPILGICVGCQVVFDMTEERNATCMGLVPGSAKRFSGGQGLKVPQIGWNTVKHRSGHWLFDGISQDSSFYFVHSYYPAPEHERDAIAWADYGLTFAAAVERGSLVAVQFHPEKSGEVGLKLLRNFLAREEG